MKTNIGKYHSNVNITVIEFGEAMSLEPTTYTVNSCAVGRKCYGNLTYFNCSDCMHFATDNDEEICINAHNIVEDVNEKMYCLKYEVNNDY